MTPLVRMTLRPQGKASNERLDTSRRNALDSFPAQAERSRPTAVEERRGR